MGRGRRVRGENGRVRFRDSREGGGTRENNYGARWEVNVIGRWSCLCESVPTGADVL